MYLSGAANGREQGEGSKPEAREARVTGGPTTNIFAEVERHGLCFDFDREPRHFCSLRPVGGCPQNRAEVKRKVYSVQGDLGLARCELESDISHATKAEGHQVYINLELVVSRGRQEEGPCCQTLPSVRNSYAWRIVPRD